MIPDELRKLKPLTGNERLGMNRDSEYLGAEDIDTGSEPILTITAIYNGNVTLQRGRENKDVIVFEEDSVPGLRNVRPLICNSTNRKTLRKLFGSVTADTLVGKQIQLYLDHNVRDPSTGDRIDGIRIRPKVPTVKRADPIICAECGKPITGFGKFSAEDIAKRATAQFGKAVCIECGKKLTEAPAPSEEVSADAEHDQTD